MAGEWRRQIWHFIYTEIAVQHTFSGAPDYNEVVSFPFVAIFSNREPVPIWVVETFHHHPVHLKQLWRRGELLRLIPRGMKTDLVVRLSVPAPLVREGCRSCVPLAGLPFNQPPAERPAEGSLVSTGVQDRRYAGDRIPVPAKARRGAFEPYVILVIVLFIDIGGRRWYTHLPRSFPEWSPGPAREDDQFSAVLTGSPLLRREP